jgi:vanillate O-demethylase ferredoxin subunit
MLNVRVKKITYQGEYLNQYEVVDPDGVLPEFEAGSHIDLYFRDGRCRQYSLCGDPKDRSRYLFTVQREENGRGGSAAIFDVVHVGRLLKISEPRNNFPLVEKSQKIILLGGGIGITPLISMAYSLRCQNREFELYYCARSPAVTAFSDLLEEFSKTSPVYIHHDEGLPSRRLDISSIIGEPSEGVHIYYCGPPGFMAGVAKVVANWPSEQVHYELFQVPDRSNPESVSGDSTINVGFSVTVKSLGKSYIIPDDKSIVEVLRENGVEVSTSCESGLCKACLMRVIEGSADHKDYVLTEEEREHFVLPCCSRSLTSSLVLDFID